MQTTLMNYSSCQDSITEMTYNAEVTPKDIYNSLLSSENLDNHKRALLYLLWDLKPHSLSEIKHFGGSQYNARIFELRHHYGFDIVNRRKLNPIQSEYVLLHREIQGHLIMVRK